MASSITLNGIPGTDAITLADWVANHPDGNAPLDWTNEANRYVSAVGFSPGRGSILLPAAALDTLDLTSKLALRIGDQDGNVVELPNLRVAGNPRCLTAGSTTPVYLVPLTDRRVDLVGTTNLRFQWRYQPWDNVENESTFGPFQGFGSGSRGATDIGTYELVCRELWRLMEADLGPWPGLPTTVPYRTKRTVDRLDLHGWRIVDALEDCLAAVGCAVAYDPRKDTFSIVYFPRATDHTVELFTKYRGQLNYDESPYTPRKFGPIPTQVSVLFPVWQGGRTGTNQRGYMGVSWAATVISTGNGTPADGNNTPFAQPSEMTTGTVYLQDFTPSRHCDNGAKIEAGVVNNRAFQVAAIFYDRLRQGSPQMPFKRSYRGVLTDERITPGGTFDVVGWGVMGDGAKTFLARSGLVGCFEIYQEIPQSGFTLASGNSGYAIGMPRTPARNIDGSVKRTGGYYPELDRDNNSFGWGGIDEGQTTVAGWSLGPLYRRGSALRQGDWISVGSGGRTDQRSRLWRNWQDMGPHDMTRFVRVTSATPTTITIPLQDVSVGTPPSTSTVSAYPARVHTQMGPPTSWNFQTTVQDAWIVEANGQSLSSGNVYLSHQGNIATDGLPVWATEKNEPITYDAWTLYATNTTTSNLGQEITSWTNLYSLSVRNNPTFPSEGWWWLSVVVSGMVKTTPSSSFAARPCYLLNYITWETTNDVQFYAPGPSGFLSGNPASSFSANASGEYSAMGTWSISVLCRVQGDTDARRGLKLYMIPYDYATNIAIATGNVETKAFGYATNFGSTLVGMRKLRDL